VITEAIVDALAEARIGETFNFYRDGNGADIRRIRLLDYLDSRVGASLLLVGEAAGYRGARVSGIPFTSERQLTGLGPAEATATIVHRVLAELDFEERVLLWNVVPTHPGTESSNRRPSRAEVEAGEPFARWLARGRRVVAVGRLAEETLRAPYVRHPSHGGVARFREQLTAALGGPARPCRLCLRTQDLGEREVAAREVADHGVEVLEPLLRNQPFVDEDGVNCRVAWPGNADLSSDAG
jgi:uracil-DNA glycosylase